jgi:hypothetical protein
VDKIIDRLIKQKEYITNNEKIFKIENDRIIVLFKQLKEAKNDK